MANKRVTLKDVADHSGVSFQTVSRVLNGGQDVAPETRERVLAAVEALRYQPSQVARALSQQKTFTIVVAVPIDPDYLFAEPHLPAPALEGLRALGYAVRSSSAPTSANSIALTSAGLLGAADPRTRGALAVGY